MRFFIYTLLAIALWYLARAAMRHYLSPQRNSGMDGSRVDRNGQHNPHAGNYESARDARFRDLE